MANERNQKKNISAYDDFLSSESFDDIDSDIAYFEKKEKGSTGTPAREAKKPARRVVAPKKAKSAAKKAPKRKRPLSPEAEERQQKRRERTAALDKRNVLIASILVCALLLLASLMTLAGRDLQYSESEKRYLAQRPAFSASAVADASYMKDMDNYLSDQFVARSAMVRFRTLADIFVGKKEIHDVYIGKKHFLFEKPAAIEQEALSKTVKSVNDFSKKNPKLNSYFVLVPSASEVIKELMPKNAPAENQTAQIKSIYGALDKSIKTIDVCSTLQGSDDKLSLYYRTDHHWTTPAAEIAFKQIAANMKLNTGKMDYESFPVTNSFQGTLAASSGLYRAKDSIIITAPKTDIRYAVSYKEENRKSASMFDSEKLKTKNQYEVFFGGNFAEVHINTTLNSNKVLLVIKDSYANCLVPMLMPYYKSIIMVDPRYYKDNLQALIKSEAVTDILWLYNVNTFVSDTSIKSVIK